MDCFYINLLIINALCIFSFCAYQTGIFCAKLFFAPNICVLRDLEISFCQNQEGVLCLYPTCLTHIY